MLHNILYLFIYTQVLEEFSILKMIGIILRMLLFEPIKKVIVCLFLKERMTIFKEKWST